MGEGWGEQMVKSKEIITKNIGYLNSRDLYDFS